jgi:hypothetical protein
MLLPQPVVDEQVCLIYVAQTLARGPLARQPYADYLAEATGPLTAEEAGAIAVLQEVLHQRLQGCN